MCGCVVSGKKVIGLPDLLDVQRPHRRQRRPIVVRSNHHHAGLAELLQDGLLVGLNEGFSRLACIITPPNSAHRPNV